MLRLQHVRRLPAHLLLISEQGQPLLHVESIENSVEEHGGVQLGRTDLQQEDVRVHHRVGKVALDVGHGLALDLEPVSHPHLAQDFIEGDLKKS